jgi:hypothetical protein
MSIWTCNTIEARVMGTCSASVTPFVHTGGFFAWCQILFLHNMPSFAALDVIALNPVLVLLDNVWSFLEAFPLGKGTSQHAAVSPIVVNNCKAQLVNLLQLHFSD